MSTYTTITDAHWAAMLAKHRAQGRIEGNQILQRIRNAVERENALTTHSTSPSCIKQTSERRAGACENSGSI